jgi:hypothetical protein
MKNVPVLNLIQYFKNRLLWNNHFYGICIVGIAFNASLYLTGYPIDFLFLLILYIGTVLYYTNAYKNERVTYHNHERVNWNLKQKEYIAKRQYFLILLVTILIILSSIKYPNILRPDILTITLVLTGLLLALFYKITAFKKRGIIKSIVIAYVWTMLGGYLPVYINRVIGHTLYLNNLDQSLYLLQLFIFLVFLAAMFDIKDIQYDQEMNIKTIPIIIGLKNIKQQLVLPAVFTLFFIDIVRYYLDPSSILILWILFYYIVFNVSKLAIKEPRIDRSILLIDGLILLKVCFEFTIYFFK